MKDGVGATLNTIEVGNCNMGECDAFYCVPLLLQLGFQKFDEMRFACASSANYHASMSPCKLFRHLFLERVVRSSANAFIFCNVVPWDIKEECAID